MKHFSEKIKTTNGTFTFYFNLINTQQEMFHVSVIDKERKVQMFDMEVTGGAWKIVDPQKCSSWIVDIEMKLTKAILDYNTDGRIEEIQGWWKTKQ